MYYWFKRLFIGCNHEYEILWEVFVKGLFIHKSLMFHQCPKCNKIRKTTLYKKLSDWS
jgi:hypothetical protein